MIRNICLSVLFSLFFSDIFSQNIFELKGQRIIIPPLKTSDLTSADYDFETNYIYKGKNNIDYFSCIYNKDALDKSKFKSKHLYSENIFGDTLDVIDVQRIKKLGIDKAILLVMKHKNNTIALHLPKKWKNRENHPNLCGLFYKSVYTYDFNTYYTYLTDENNIVLNHYNVYSLDSINNKYRDKYVYITSYRKYHNGYEYDYNGTLKRQVKYKYNGMVFSDNEKFSNRYYYEHFGNYNWYNEDNFKIMCVILESPNKELVYIPIKSAKSTYKKESILDYFETEEEFIANSKKQYDIQTIDYLNKKYVGKEVYVKHHNYDSGIGSGYYILKNIELCPSNNEEDIYFKYYALLEDSDKRTYNFLITSDFEEKIIYAEEQRKIEEENARKRAQEEAEYRAKIEREEREYKANLIKKYGKDNALLILDGQVKIGFTKEMCIESWGRPYDINRTVTAYGTHEQWVYGLWCYLYFEDGILTAIQN